MRRVLVSSSIVAALASVAVPAHADPNDLALNRLSFYDRSDPSAATRDWVYAGGCGGEEVMYRSCQADHGMFVNLMNQLGGALAPGLLAPARTIGYNGLYFAYEASISGIDGSADYWRRGTEGTQRDRMLTPGTNPTSVVRETVPNALYVHRLHVRKGFPYGFELGLQGSWLHDSTIIGLGLDIRWAPLEGFFRGIGYLPDFAVRGSVNTIVGQQQLYMTMISVDGSLSKTIPIAGVMSLTPFGGYQSLFILGDSTVVDGTPLRSAFQECPRRHVAFGMDMGNTTSALVCDTVNLPAPNAGDDSRNDMVFTAARIWRNRLFFGLRFRYGILSVTGEFGFDIVNPQFSSAPDSMNNPNGRPVAQSGPDSNRRNQISLDGFQQWTTSFGVGLHFN